MFKKMRMKKLAEEIKREFLFGLEEAEEQYNQDHDVVSYFAKKINLKNKYDERMRKIGA